MMLVFLVFLGCDLDCEVSIINLILFGCVLKLYFIFFEFELFVFIFYYIV